MGEPTLLWLATAVVTAAIVLPYFVRFRRRIAVDRERKAEARQLGIDRPAAQFPYIDVSHCIGCGACVRACPEGDVLGIVGGTSVVVNGLRCVGHSRCEEACPVGAIEVGLGDLKSRKDMPLLDERLETTVRGIYIAGELGGLSLVRNAIRQGRSAVLEIAEELESRDRDPEVLDLAIVGSGPAGISAGLTAAERRLGYRIFEREKDLGGSILHYPRRKMVLTQPVELEPWGKLQREEYSKEDLLEILSGAVRQHELPICYGLPVQAVERENGHFRVQAGGSSHRARRVLLAMGRRGEPRKLGVPGEELSKVMYRLLDAESYSGQRILVVGGGDSAIEAAIGLARQGTNQVTLSYRKERLVRIKKRNQVAADEMLASGAIEPVFSSNVVEILPGSVRLRVGEDEEREIENDYVFIFAGGVPPFGLMREMGIAFGGEATAA